VINNPDGGRSAAFPFQVTSPISNPTVASISPATPTAQNQNQIITVNGSSFQAGLTVTVNFPGGSSTLSGTQIQGVTASSFQMVALLGIPGSYSIVINNPDGGRSAAFPFQVTSPISNPTVTSISPVT